MQKLSPKFSVWFLIVSVLTLNGCRAAYNREFEADAKKEGWTVERTKANLAYSYREMFLLENKDKQLVVNYSVLPKEWVRQVFEESLNDIQGVLDYRNEANVQYTEFFGLRDYLTQEERRLKVVLNRIKTAELYDKFEDLTGTSGFSSYDEYRGNHENQGDENYEDYGNYDGSEYQQQDNSKKRGFAWKIFLPQDVKTLFKFELDKVESARKKGNLRLIETSGLFIDKKYDRKESDPAKPNDPNSFIWKPRKIALELQINKIVFDDKEVPLDNNLDYAEVYRVTSLSPLAKELLPCVRAFRVFDGVVVLIDTNREGEVGYGSPDQITKIYNFDSIKSIFSDQNVLDLIFKDSSEVILQTPPKKEALFVEFAPAGQLTDVWEDAADPSGWPWPLFRFKNEVKDNYNVKLDFQDKKSDDKNNGKLKKIKAVKKEWYGGSYNSPSVGAVVEYYQPKDVAAQELASAEVLWREDTKKIVFVLPNGSEERGMILPGSNKFIEDEPFAVEYNEGQKRYRIEKFNGSKVFNKKKQISNVDGKTGVYTK